MISSNFRSLRRIQQATDKDEDAGGLLELLGQLKQQATPESASDQPLNLPLQGLPGRLLALQANQELSAPRQPFEPNANFVDQGPIAHSPNVSLPKLIDQQYAMGRKPTMSECVDRCLHLLPSPSGDLQSSEFRQCVDKCMGKL